MNKTLFIIVCFTLLACKIQGQCNDISISDGLIQYSGSEYDSLKSVGKIRGSTNCTGTFINTSTNQNAPAYVVTNGHCATAWDANEIITNVEPEDLHIDFNVFQNTTNAVISTTVVKIEYATMKGRDIAILRLNKTIGEMINLGLNPINISTETPQINDPVKIVGVPVSGIPLEEQFLRMSNCSMKGQAPLITESSWFWFDTFKNECSGIFGGSSGSPVFSCFDTGFYGIINTTNHDSNVPCAFNSPCESDELTPKYPEDTNYVIDVRQVLNCFNANGVFSMNTSNFPYDKKNYLKTTINNPIDINPDLPSSTTHLDIIISNTPYYRYKLSSYDVSNPRVLSGYGNVIETATNNTILDEIPNIEGVYVLSIIGGDTATFDANWQQPEHANLLIFYVDKTSPDETPGFNLIEENETNYVYEIFSGYARLGDVQYAFGDLDFDETDLNLYSPYFVFQTLEKNNGPYKICGFIKDWAGNSGPTKCWYLPTSLQNNVAVLEKKVNVFPNPTSNFLNINLKNSQNHFNYELFTASGQRIQSGQLKLENNRLNLSKLSNGIYFLKFNNNTTSWVKKIIIN